MHPRDCPEWEYDRIPNARVTVRDRAVQLLLQLRADRDRCATVASETRPAHAELFQGLTPARCDYYAGHYRGEELRCLKHYPVGIASDPMVGYDPQLVLGEMGLLGTTIRDGIVALDAFVASGRSRVACLIQIVKVAAHVFELFLRIHPYANGNGHAGRLIVCALFGRYGFWMSRWTVEPRPKDPPYSGAIAQYRRGTVADLEKFMLECAKWGEPAQPAAAVAATPTSAPAAASPPGTAPVPAAASAAPPSPAATSQGPAPRAPTTPAQAPDGGSDDPSA
jgi:hypothetical protein